MTAPERIEYIVQPLDADGGEIEIEGGLSSISIDVTDLNDSVTLVMAPDDLKRETADRIQAALRQAMSEQEGRRFFLFKGRMGERWHAVRLVRRDVWDDEFGEAR
jgi:hypothetical protein